MSTTEQKPSRPHRTRNIVIASAAVVALCTGASAAISAQWPDSTEGPDRSAAPHSAEVQKSLDGLVTETGFPGALAAVTSADGTTADYVTGVSEIGTTTPVPADSFVRIGSNTKMYVAVVVMQLVDEGKVALDEPVETYLPGILEPFGTDAATITVRQLLQHTSGLPNYTAAVVGEMDDMRYRYLAPRDLVDLAYELPVSFAPGEKWEYSNTNYIVAGLIIEKATGRALVSEIEDRIVDRLELTETSFPNVGDVSIPSPHPEGYYSALGEPLENYTELDPSWAWAAGQMIATPSDLNRFMEAIVDGELMSDAALSEMQETVPADDIWEGARYGLGLMSYPVSCGGLAWGHGGDIPGFETRNAAIPGGTSVTVAVTTLPGSLAKDEADAYSVAGAVNGTLDVALCAD